jgi:broad specificity phosphatase PhoE
MFNVLLFIFILMLLSSTLAKGWMHRNARRQRLQNTAVKMLKEYTTVPMEELIGGVQSIPVPLSFWQTALGKPLKNMYIGLRHGESTANKAGVISSNADIGSKMHNLTPLGKVQARSAGYALIELLGMEAVVGQKGRSDLLFVSSNFTRARETAAECALAIDSMRRFQDSPLCRDDEQPASQVAQVIIRNELRERFFGELDAQPLIFYNRVWPIDAIDSTNKRDGVESVVEVIGRISSLVASLEATYEDKILVLTSHADTLQIAQTFLARGDPRKFAEYRFANGEVRNLLQLPNKATPMVYK